MIRNRDIIVVNLTPWDFEFGNNCRNISEVFAETNRVLYVNPPLDRITSMRDKEDPRIQKRLEIVAGRRDGLEQLSDSLWTLYPKTMIESINWIPNGTVFDWMNKRNNKRFAADIREAAARLGFSDYLMFNDNDIFRCFHLKELLEPTAYIYYIRDQLIAVDYWKRHGIRVEARHMEKADAIVANSTHLADYGRKFNPNSHYVGQGCDLSEWDESLVKEIPSDIRTIPGPVIGYVGALNSLRLDIDLLVEVAKQRPDWSIVLVGPEDDAFRESALHSLSNVSFLGSKPPEQLPSYVQAFDVCINPQTVNPVTIGNYPRKIDEYLAMGKPTVATLTKAMEIFAEHTYLASNAAEWVEMIRLALEEDSSQKSQARKAFAATHTWENNVLEIYKVIANLNNNPTQKNQQENQDEPLTCSFDYGRNCRKNKIES